jgi:hypothetical protein
MYYVIGLIVDDYGVGGGEIFGECILSELLVAGWGRAMTFPGFAVEEG